MFVALLLNSIYATGLHWLFSEGSCWLSPLFSQRISALLAVQPMMGALLVL